MDMPAPQNLQTRDRRGFENFPESIVPSDLCAEHRNPRDPRREHESNVLRVRRELVLLPPEPSGNESDIQQFPKFAAIRIGCSVPIMAGFRCEPCNEIHYHFLDQIFNSCMARPSETRDGT